MNFPPSFKNHHPTSDLILIEVIEEQERQTEGGVIMPQTSKDSKRKLRNGKVLAIGPQVSNSLLEMVTFPPYVGREIVIDKKEYLLVRLIDICTTYYVEEEE